MDPTQHQQLMAALNHVTGFLERIALAIEQMALEMPGPAAQPAPSLGSSSLGAIVEKVLPSVWVCPIHGGSRTVPAGVSQRTGKSYTAFLACSTPGCDMKPPRVAEQQRLP